MKKASVIALVLGIKMIITSVVPPILSLISLAVKDALDATGIIGGADAPTYILVAREAFRGFPTMLLLFGTALVSASIITFIICKKKK